MCNSQNFISRVQFCNIKITHILSVLIIEHNYTVLETQTWQSFCLVLPCYSWLCTCYLHLWCDAPVPARQTIYVLCLLFTSCKKKKECAHTVYFMLSVLMMEAVHTMLCLCCVFWQKLHWCINKVSCCNSASSWELTSFCKHILQLNFSFPFIKAFKSEYEIKWLRFICHVLLFFFFWMGIS